MAVFDDLRDADRFDAVLTFDLDDGDPFQVPIDQLIDSVSPRLGGVNDEHVRGLAESAVELPPILVHRPTMRVIDGMHRLRAAALIGRREIPVRYFSGSEKDAFVLAVHANVAHGLPLSLADRTASAERIIGSHPEWSDRAVAVATGLSHQTVGHIRGRANGDSDQLHTRVGRDGRVRPLDSTNGRRIASDVLRDDPSASLRQVARIAGISPGTARDVRDRLARGEDPVPNRQRAGGSRRAVTAEHPFDSVQSARIMSVLESLRRDPSLRLKESGRAVLRVLGAHAVIAAGPQAFIEAVPPHCAGLVADVAAGYAVAWQRVADVIRQRDKASA
ncbi:ParB/RepB/Spo0J family partition protein [Dactylosporangium sp. NPDC051485]|uniref:ParB/RepB/Spo0J family partition protein n=1 Tax=Dactylosporangium sp. NPDC051485 TaxID=3154846 RepID=UPI00342CD814